MAVDTREPSGIAFVSRRAQSTGPPELRRKGCWVYLHEPSTGVLPECHELIGDAHLEDVVPVRTGWAAGGYEAGADRFRGPGRCRGGGRTCNGRSGERCHTVRQECAHGCSFRELFRGSGDCGTCAPHGLAGRRDGAGLAPARYPARAIDSRARWLVSQRPVT